ncbi:HI0074 family nucleotidyltransferase substrate-binding subunit [Alkaliphilus peptidifermentans]|uniref:Nucleotidyltransferase substrate binding protein, HI0074 family n=1 Tax=Alkaliphilus peptidifermentans DSM 18978 TaxID=1120976 RepID=A0A1G5AFJ6_9FIRM|nr:HI0074 family nucleotidyltransferase substrate-binding subunit [Alkaliphilus peptidifermentans]SCX76642.1 nucleotidyltransferase substrate binding protein, HI0074 family [Alkaliphilus peptidifermentans DSM 18978]
MAERYGLSKKTFYHIINILKKYSVCVEKAILFGSRARGDYKKSSDIDIAIKFRKDDLRLYQIKDELLQQNIVYTLDIIDYDKVSNNKLKSDIIKEGKVIFSSDAEGGIVVNINKIKDKIDDLERAIKKLHDSLSRDHTQDDIVIDATIQRFEFTYELSWKLMKAYLEYNGNLEGTSPRKAIQESFKEGIIEDGEGWLQMLQDRNQTSHTYDEETALEIYEHIKQKYILYFNEFLNNIKNQV